MCAPSNAAIDEVASRLKEGYRGTQKRRDPIKVVRIGSDKAIDISVRDIALDYLVEQKMNGENMQDSSNDAGKQITLLRQEIESVKRTKQEKLEELGTIQNNTARTLALEEEIKKLNSRRMALTQQFDRLKDKQKSDNRTLDAARRRMRFQILQEADVICATLAGSGHESIEQLEFDMVIIDEAAQAVELTSLIPLKFHTSKCIMVGGGNSILAKARSIMYLLAYFFRSSTTPAHRTLTRGYDSPCISRFPPDRSYLGL